VNEHPAVRGGQPPREAFPELRVKIVSDDAIAQAEAEFVLQAFEELKSMGDAELKISVAMDRESGHPEIIYAGVQKKRSLETLRKVYRARRGQKVAAR
jgi:hypothetical protein